MSSHQHQVDSTEKSVKMDEMVNLKSAPMTDNQRYVEVSGRKHEVNVETDLSFYNRPRSGYEAATQSFCPMVEQDTDRSLFFQCLQPINCAAKRTVTIRTLSAKRT